MKKIAKRQTRLPATRRAVTRGPTASVPDADAHMGATEDQVVPTLTPGSGQIDGDRRADSTNRAIDPTAEITPG